VEASKQKEEKRKKPKPEEQEGIPQRQHCPPEKCRRKDDKNKSKWRPPSKKKKRGKNLSPRNRKAYHTVSTALVKSVAGKTTKTKVSGGLQAKRRKEENI
jgi:hypothetical protein